jgi:hypothetical protein
MAVAYVQICPAVGADCNKINGMGVRRADCPGLLLILLSLSMYFNKLKYINKNE